MNEQEFEKIYTNILNNQKETDLDKRQDYIIEQTKQLAELNNISFNKALERTYNMFLTQYFEEKDKKVEKVLHGIATELQMIQLLNPDKLIINIASQNKSTAQDNYLWKSIMILAEQIHNLRDDHYV